LSALSIHVLEYVALGVTAGFLAGMLGVGGGLIIVPVLTYMFAAQNMPDQYIAHLAIGTSLATIIFTSISSINTHHKHSAVNWTIVGKVSPGIIIGTLLGSYCASSLSSNFLKGFFVLFLLYVSLQMLLDIRPKSHYRIPGAAGLLGAGGVIGGLSSLVGIGGGSMSVPFLIWCNLPAHKAVGTSAAIGFPIALAGTVGYIINGIHIAKLPSLSYGFVYLPAVAWISFASYITAPFGARLAHRLPVPILKKVFAGFLLIVAIKLIWGII
jgi:uncharacterized membrane protein YfcA